MLIACRPPASDLGRIARSRQQNPTRASGRPSTGMIRNKRQCWDISKQSAASLSYAVVLTASLSGLAGAKEAPPERLTIGYEDEGKIDASPQACLTWVNEETE